MIDLDCNSSNLCLYAALSPEPTSYWVL